MKKRAMTFLAGMLAMALIFSGALAVYGNGSLQTLSNVRVGGIRLVVDGKEVQPSMANGKVMEPMIYNGTTYLPVRDVASALGKAISWDGPTYTVYIGDMDGKLEYPTVMLKDMMDISPNDGYGQLNFTDRLTDNYGNVYGSAIINNQYGNKYGGLGLEYLLNMKYSHFKGTIYIPQGQTSDDSHVVTITADGKQLWKSPALTKTSGPVPFDINVTGYNDIKIEIPPSDYRGLRICIGDAGFYQ